MGILGTTRRRIAVVAAATAFVGMGAAGLAIASTNSSSAPPSNAMSKGMGVDEFGMTHAYLHGMKVHFTYTKGFYCDTKVKSHASSKCEAGANFKKAPSKQYDPLYITVPLGFNRSMKMDCPSGLVCVDHPGTIDLTRLEPALKPLYPGLSKHQLHKALKNFAVPGHDHFITTAFHGKPEWWDVKIVGVTSAKTYNRIIKHESYGYIKHLVKSGNKHVTAPIPTNLFLYFGVGIGQPNK